MIKEIRQYIILRKLEDRTSCAQNTFGIFAFTEIPTYYIGPGSLRNRYLKRKIILLDKNPWLWKIDSWVRKYERLRFRFFWKSMLLDFYKTPFKESANES